MVEKEISASKSLRQFIGSVLNERDKGLTARYDEGRDTFILRYIFEMEGKNYLGRVPLNKTEAHNLAEYILSVK